MCETWTSNPLECILFCPWALSPLMPGVLNQKKKKDGIPFSPAEGFLALWGLNPIFHLNDFPCCLLMEDFILNDNFPISGIGSHLFDITPLPTMKTEIPVLLKLRGFTNLQIGALLRSTKARIYSIYVLHLTRCIQITPMFHLCFIPHILLYLLFLFLCHSHQNKYGYVCLLCWSFNSFHVALLCFAISHSSTEKR